jgi:deoxycytidine triphosphate deaminase
MLNSAQILDEQLLSLEHTKGKPAQVGYDLSIKNINKVGGRSGFNDYKIGKVLKDKTELTNYTHQPLTEMDGCKGYFLLPGIYDITFNEGCVIPENRVAFIKQRSSLYRNGAIINSPVFDPGFETEFMGTLMYIHEAIFIEQDARVAQIYFHECEPTELYSGQWQGDKQRNSL